MNLEETEARNNCAGETNRPTNLFSRECEDTWSHGLSARQSPAGNDVSRRAHCSDPLPGNN
jgi:hypothetical protein